jgi:hypothetical protein
MSAWDLRLDEFHILQCRYFVRGIVLLAAHIGLRKIRQALDEDLTMMNFLCAVHGCGLCFKHLEHYQV